MSGPPHLEIRINDYVTWSEDPVLTTPNPKRRHGGTPGQQLPYEIGILRPVWIMMNSYSNTKVGKQQLLRKSVKFHLETRH